MTRCAHLVVLSLLAACAAAPQGPPQHDYTFVFLRHGPKRSATPQDQLAALQNGHMANIQRLAAAGDLLLAGPFGTPSPEPELRGLFVFKSNDLRHVESLIATDPMIQAQVLAGEVVPWHTNADLFAAMERWNEFEASAKDDPSFDFMKGMKMYFAVFADDARRADLALAPLRAQGKVVLEGHFGGGREGQALYLVDAANAAAGSTLLAPLGELGTTRNTPWFGSAFLR